MSTAGSAGAGWIDDAASLMSGRRPDVQAVLDALYDQPNWDKHLFYPVPRSGHFEWLKRFHERPWNNIGSRNGSPPGGNHTKPVERAVLQWSADLLLGLSGDQWWGNLTTGGTAGNRAGLLAARDSFPVNEYGLTTAVCYYAASDHYSIPKLLGELCIPGVLVHARPDGTMDYDHLAEVIQPDSPAIVVCTIGTTTTEAVTDPGQVVQVLNARGVANYYLHGDGALSIIPMAVSGLLPVGLLHSISYSGAKFLGSNSPTGGIVGRRYQQRREQHIAYVNIIDDSPIGSIDGVPALAMWLTVAIEGNDGLREISEDCRLLAAYLTARLNQIGFSAWRFDHAFTVNFPEPPAAIMDNWPVYRDAAGQCHLICMPGVTRAQVDDFVDALYAALYAEVPTITRQRAGSTMRALPSGIDQAGRLAG